MGRLTAPKIQPQVANQATQTTVSSSPTPKSSTISVNTSDWKTVNLKTVHLEFKLSPQLSKLGELKEEVVEGGKGTEYCVRFPAKTSWLVKTVYAGGGCFSDNPAKFRLGTTSVDYEAGRSGAFTDYQGFEVKDGKYYAKFVQGKTTDIPSDLVQEISNSNGLKIIKIKGDSPPTPGYEMGYPLFGSLGKGWIGALINLNGTTYTGIALQMELDQDLTENMFDQMLSTFKSTQ